jgi:hypothetical protein
MHATMSVRGAVSALAVMAALAGAATVAGGDEFYRLASAQVVTFTDRAPVLKLAANGPIAFTVLPPEDGTSPDPQRVRLRLHGVAPGGPATLAGLAPFVVSVVAEPRGSLVTVSLPGLPSGAQLHVRAGVQSNEIEVRSVPAGD